MASGRRSAQRDTLRRLLDEEEPQEKGAEKPITPPPKTPTTESKTFDNGKSSPPPNGSQSPDPNCSICLGKLENKSFTDSCFHMFCFACLLEWSKVKAECPLCKQPFKSIIHNVRSYEDYDQYNLQERNGFPWENTEGSRFRYRTTLTFDRLMDAHYEEQQRQLRLLQRPTMMRTRSHWRRRRQGATSEFRQRIYLNGMRVVRVAARQTRQRKTGPAFYNSNPAVTHRLVPWLNRELNALLHCQNGHVHFLMELIMDLIKRFDIESDEFYEHLHPYLGRHTRHFLHEFANFARSPYDMVAYDQHAVYEPHTETIESDEDTLSSAGSDIIIVDDIPESQPRRPRGNQMLDLETPEVELNTEIVTTSASGWDSPTPGTSQLLSNHSELPQPTSLTNIHNHSASGNYQPSPTHLPEKDGSDSDSNSVVIVKVEKPWYERTPITLSSDSEAEMLIKDYDVHRNDSRKKLVNNEKEITSASLHSSSDMIDVSSISPQHKKHKSKHRRQHRKHKHKRSRESSSHTHSSSSKKSTHHSKSERTSRRLNQSERQESRRAAEARRKHRHSESHHSLHSGSHSLSDYSSVSSVYGFRGSVRGKFGEFFEWLHHNENCAHGDHANYSRSDSYMSRSRSRETLWPSSSTSHSPSVSPQKRNSKTESHNSKRSRSNSVECVTVISSTISTDGDRKRHKKHKKHKKHKEKKSREEKEFSTHDNDSEVEIIDYLDNEIVEIISGTEGTKSAGRLKLNPAEESSSQQQESADSQQTSMNIDTELPTSSSSPSKSTESTKKYKKHPTGHKTSQHKTVKIKRDTKLMRSLEQFTKSLLNSYGTKLRSDIVKLDPGNKVSANSNDHQSTNSKLHVSDHSSFKEELKESHLDSNPLNLYSLTNESNDTVSTFNESNVISKSSNSVSDKANVISTCQNLSKSPDIDVTGEISETPEECKSPVIDVVGDVPFSHDVDPIISVLDDISKSPDHNISSSLVGVVDDISKSPDNNVSSSPVGVVGDISETSDIDVTNPVCSFDSKSPVVKMDGEILQEPVSGGSCNVLKGSKSPVPDNTDAIHVLKPKNILAVDNLETSIVDTSNTVSFSSPVIETPNNSKSPDIDVVSLDVSAHSRLTNNAQSKMEEYIDVVSEDVDDDSELEDQEQKINTMGESHGLFNMHKTKSLINSGSVSNHFHRSKEGNSSTADNHSDFHKPKGHKTPREVGKLCEDYIDVVSVEQLSTKAVDLCDNNQPLNTADSSEISEHLKARSPQDFSNQEKESVNPDLISGSGQNFDLQTSADNLSVQTDLCLNSDRERENSDNDPNQELSTDVTQQVQYDQTLPKSPSNITASKDDVCHPSIDKVCVNSESQQTVPEQPVEESSVVDYSVTPLSETVH